MDLSLMPGRFRPRKLTTKQYYEQQRVRKEWLELWRIKIAQLEKTGYEIIGR